MGRKLDLSGLSDSEAEHVLQVVQRDMKLRKKEEERISELRQELDEEGSRRLLLSRQRCFNQRCCIRCCSPFTFLLNPKRQCHDCQYNVCKACRVYNKIERAWLCSTCQKNRLLKTQPLEWFYNNVKKRFKRFGSAKVLKTFYRKHLVEHRTLSELTEGSAYEESVYNEGSICGSDSAFYRQTEEHSMAETLSVALRVAEEAIDEAISKARFDTSSQENHNEVRYLQEHRGELIEELAKNIVEKIISRGKSLAETRAEYNRDWLLEHNTDHHHQISSSLKYQPSLWRSQSAFSLVDGDPPRLNQHSPHALKKEGNASAMSTWKSVDWLDDAGVSSVLKSPDGNWIALQTAQLSHPSLLSRRKSLVYSSLERESAVVSAYEGMGLDNDTRAEHNASHGAALQEIHRTIMDSNICGRKPASVTEPRMGRESLITDSEGNWKHHESVLALLKWKVSAELMQPSPMYVTDSVDINFNVEEVGEEEEREVAAEQEVKDAASLSLLDYSKTNNQPQIASDALVSDTLTTGATTPDPFDLENDITSHRANQVDQELIIRLQQLASHVSDTSTGEEEEGKGGRDSGSDVQMYARSQENDRGEEEQSWRMETDEGRMEDEEEDEETMKNRLSRLVAQARLTYFTSTDDELDRAGASGGEWEEHRDEKQKDKNRENLPYKICQLEKEVGASQFSSTEDELDRVGMKEEEDNRTEELALKVCRLADQINATQFSCTEEEVDGAARGEEEAEEESLWKFHMEKAIQVAQLRDLSSLVGASQFSSTEEELDGEIKGRNGGGVEDRSGKNKERRESFADLDVKMFDLRADIEGRDEKETEKQKKVEEEGDYREETEDEGMIKKHVCETEERPEIEALNDNQPQAKCSDTEWGVRDSGEEDEEFEKIINSMLMMTLEDMQGVTLDEGNAGNGKRVGEADENPKTGRESGFEDVDAQKKNGSEECPHENVMLGSADTEMSGGNVTEQIGHKNHGVKASGDATANKKYEPREKDSDLPDQMLLTKRSTVVTIGETDDVAQTGRDGNDNEPEDGSETKMKGGDATEGGCESKETEENLEETANAAEQRDTSLSPEEVQIVSELELYKTLEFLTTLLEQRYSAVSLRSITTEVLKVLNATEELLQGVEGGDHRLDTTTLPPNTDPKKLDQQFSRLEENVYVAAGTVYGLEVELRDLEECARGVCSTTSDMELSFLEEQVASAAAKIQQSELQVCDISARIAALKSAGLNVDTQARVTKTRTIPVMPLTLNSSRQLRRRLPVPPVKEHKET